MIDFYDVKPMNVTLPMHLVFVILETDSVVKCQTASSSYKPATIQNGIKIQVPPFINQGDRILIDSVTREYTKKAN